MSTSIALSAAANANAAAAAAEASHAQDMACHAIIAAYDPKVARVDQMQTYATCVQRIYPSSSEIPPVVAKVSIIVLIVALIIGVFKGWQEDGFIGAVAIGFLAPAFLAICAVVLWAIVCGIMYVVS